MDAIGSVPASANKPEPAPAAPVAQPDPPVAPTPTGDQVELSPEARAYLEAPQEDPDPVGSLTPLDEPEPDPDPVGSLTPLDEPEPDPDPVGSLTPLNEPEPDPVLTPLNQPEPDPVLTPLNQPEPASASPIPLPSSPWAGVRSPWDVARSAMSLAGGVNKALGETVQGAGQALNGAAGWLEEQGKKTPLDTASAIKVGVAVGALGFAGDFVEGLGAAEKFSGELLQGDPQALAVVGGVVRGAADGVALVGGASLTNVGVATTLAGQALGNDVLSATGRGLEDAGEAVTGLASPQSRAALTEVGLAGVHYAGRFDEWAGDRLTETGRSVGNDSLIGAGQALSLGGKLLQEAAPANDLVKGVDGFVDDRLQEYRQDGPLAVSRDVTRIGLEVGSLFVGPELLLGKAGGKAVTTGVRLADELNDGRRALGLVDDLPTIPNLETRPVGPRPMPRRSVDPALTPDLSTNPALPRIPDGPGQDVPTLPRQRPDLTRTDLPPGDFLTDPHLPRVDPGDLGVPRVPLAEDLSTGRVLKAYVEDGHPVLVRELSDGGTAEIRVLPGGQRQVRIAHYTNDEGKSGISLSRVLMGENGRETLAIAGSLTDRTIDGIGGAGGPATGKLHRLEAWIDSQHLAWAQSRQYGQGGLALIADPRSSDVVAPLFDSRWRAAVGGEPRAFIADYYTQFLGPRGIPEP